MNSQKCAPEERIQLKGLRSLETHSYTKINKLSYTERLIRSTNKAHPTHCLKLHKKLERQLIKQELISRK